ncbi:hypothetical protein D3C84_672630 [compost metagenome]
MLKRKPSSALSGLRRAEEYRIELRECPNKIANRIASPVEENSGDLSCTKAKFCLLVDGIFNVPADAHDRVTRLGEGEWIHVAETLLIKPFALRFSCQHLRRWKSLLLNELLQGSILERLRQLCNELIRFGSRLSKRSRIEQAVVEIGIQLECGLDNFRFFAYRIDDNEPISGTKPNLFEFSDNEQ